MLVYADNAATTKMSPGAINAMLPYLDKIYGNSSSLHSIGQAAAEGQLLVVEQRIGDQPRGQALFGFGRVTRDGETQVFIDAAIHVGEVQFDLVRGRWQGHGGLLGWSGKSPSLPRNIFRRPTGHKRIVSHLSRPDARHDRMLYLQELRP